MTSKAFDVPSAMVGKLIGKGGETIRNLQLSTDTRIQVDHAAEGPTKRITISGYDPDQVERARGEIMKLEAQEENQKVVDCPPNVVGRIIGRGGETIRALQSASEAHITVNQDFPPDVPRQIIIQGPSDAIDRAVLMINELIHGEPGSAQAIIQRVCQAHNIGKSDRVTAPKAIIGRIIGRGGDMIKQIQKVSGATVQIDQSTDPCTIALAGQPAAVDSARAIVLEIINGGDPFGMLPPSATALSPQMGGAGMPSMPSMPGGMMMGYGGGMYGGMAPQYGGGGGVGGGMYGVPPAAAAPGGYYAPSAASAPSYPMGYGAYPSSAMPQPQYSMPRQQQQQRGGGRGAGGGAAHSNGNHSGGGGGGGGNKRTEDEGMQGKGGWVMYRDQQGRSYFYNELTQVTQWERPFDF